MIEIIKDKNYFEVEANTRIITINCVGAMGAGLAKWFRTHHWDEYLKYREKCNRGLIKIGHCEVVETSQCRYIYFPTKLHWQNPSCLEYIEEGLKHLSEIIQSDWVITIPPLGCGNGGLSFDVILEMIYDHLSEVDSHIKIVY